MTIEDGHDHHSPQISNVSRMFVAGIILNSLFVCIEFFAGLYYNSLALLSDAGHNLSDVAGLGLALFAYKISKAKTSRKFTYGYHKSTILVSLVNAVILLIAVGGIGVEAFQRFFNPEITQGKVISIVAFIGILVNAASALLFFRDRKKDLNIRGAYLHLAMDAVVSFGVVIAGAIIYYTGITWIDPAISIIIMLIVIISTWKLLTESLRLTLDAVPENVNMDEIMNLVKKMPGIKGIHHIHIWAMSTTKNAMTAHLILEEGLPESQIVEMKNKLKHDLLHSNIHHTTFETELNHCYDDID